MVLENIIRLWQTLYCVVLWYCNKKLEQEELPLTLILDIAKAFDTISYNIIL